MGRFVTILLAAFCLSHALHDMADYIAADQTSHSAGGQSNRKLCRTSSNLSLSPSNWLSTV